MIQKVEMTGRWSLKWPLIALGIYGGLLFPLTHLVFPGNRGSIYLYPAYLVLVLSLLLLRHRGTWLDLGFRRDHVFLHLLLGIMPGVLVIATVPLLDLFIATSGLAETELFRGANQRSGSLDSNLYRVIQILILPFLEQIFFFGFVTQSLIRKMKPASALYLGTLIFTLAHFDIELGMFFIGFAGAGFYFLTGTIYAGLAFQIACHTGGFVLMQFYPRVLTLLGFLF